MDLSLALVLVLLLACKHIICDFVLKPFIQNTESNLISIGIPAGGIVCSAVHAFGSAIVLSITFHISWIILILCIMECIIHYYIHLVSGDILTTNIKEIEELIKKNGWWLDGFNQWLHFMSYLIFVIFICKLNIFT